MEFIGQFGQIAKHEFKSIHSYGQNDDYGMTQRYLWNTGLFPNKGIVGYVLGVVVWSFVCIYERPILGDNPKPHKSASENRCAFHEKRSAFHFSLHFSLFAVLFTEKQCTFHFSLCFSLISSVFFTFRCTFH